MKALVAGRRRWILLAIAVAGIWSAIHIDLRPSLLLDNPSPGTAIDFFAAAFQPALTYEAEFVPDGTAPLWVKVLEALGRTVMFAAASIGLSIPIGLFLGFLGSSAWWSRSLSEAATTRTRLLRIVAPVLTSCTRVVTALMRSIHELLWAVLLLVAIGNNHLAAVIAIAIPFAGTLAKIFAEMIDEAPDRAAEALRSAGASPTQVFLFGLVPTVFADLCSYAIYRFECALRSSAILGFFGIPTLGYYLKLSFENLHYHEVWTYLYALFALVLLVDAWSGRLRRELTA